MYPTTDPIEIYGGNVLTLPTPSLKPDCSTSCFIIQQIVTLSKYGYIALDICHPYVTDILRYTYFCRGKKKTSKNVDGMIPILQKRVVSIC